MRFAALLLAAGPALAQTPATPATRAANAALLAQLPFDDRQDYAFASRGFVAAPRESAIRDARGAVVRDLADDRFLDAPAPPSVNPSLWRNAQLTAKAGLFKVADGIWQVRGLDMANMTLIAGRTGWIVVDPLTTHEVAAAALALADRHLGKRPVAAIIYTHSHIDHFGGAGGIVDAGAVRAGRVPVYAPAGFFDHAVSENVIAGNAMGRRADYQFGTPLPRGPLGAVGSGIGAERVGGTASLIAPTHEIARSGETLTIDGVRFEFQLTPGTEAPAEMNFYLPDLRALCLAENANGAMHNVLTPRGALVRDAKAWADYLTESLRRYGRRSDVLFTSHHWPRWDAATIAGYIATHRDAYKFVHDQSVRLMNAGLTGPEIAEAMTLPAPLAKAWHNRGHYGSWKFNARAVYQRYMGFYDGNPANLDPLPPADAARRWVAALGGAAKVLALARAADEDRWRVELLSKLVFAEPSNAAAREALAAAYDQLGYRAESGPWRNMYLTAAQELRAGIRPPRRIVDAAGVGAQLPIGQLLDLLAVRVVPERALAPLSLAFVVPDAKERHLVTVANGVLVHETGVDDPAQATLTASRADLLALVAGRAHAPALVAAGRLRIDGDRSVLARFVGLFETPPRDFPIVLP